MCADQEVIRCEVNAVFSVEDGNTPDPVLLASCVSTSKDIPCESITRLMFFSFINIIMTILILGIIYFVYVKKFEK